MSKLLMVIVALVIAIVVYFFYQGYVSKSGTAPGLVNGALTACPDKPNCAVTELSLDQQQADALGRLANIIINTGGVVQMRSDQYLSAIYSSSIFGFVDDVEAHLDQGKGVLKLRSASRVGHSDLGVNQKRLDTLTEAWNK